MRRSDGGEMPSVKRDDRVRIETCCKSDQAGIGSAEREVGIPVDEVGDDWPVVGCRCFNVNVVDALEERGFGGWSQSSAVSSCGSIRPYRSTALHLGVGVPVAAAGVVECDDDLAGFDDEFVVVAVDWRVGPPAVLNQPVLADRGDLPAFPVHDDRVGNAGGPRDHTEGSWLVETA